MNESIQFRFIGRDGCHLCDDMLDQLVQLQQNYDFELVQVDVEESQELEQAYGHKVPVLMFHNQEICHFTLDTGRFCQLLRKHSKQ